MDDEDKDEVHLVSMMPVNNDDEMDSEYHIDGVNVAEYLPAVTSETDTVLSRFVRNEISYDEFMRLSGGQTIDEELGDAGIDDDYDDQMIPGPSGTNYTAPIPTAEGDLPFFVRNLMKEVINEENDPNGSSIPMPKSYDDDEQARIPSEQSAFHAPEGKTPARKIAKTMDALLGQANVEYARGNIPQALALLLEVIRTDPRNAAAYQQISDMYTECGDKQKSLQYGLLAAHLNTKTPAEMWARWGDLSTELNLLDEASACYGRAIKLDMGNFTYYEKRIKTLDAMGSRPLAMRMRLQAMQEITNKDSMVDWSWFELSIREVANYFIGVNDEDKAITCLEIFITRSREFNQSATHQHEQLLTMLLDKQRYLEASRSILALVDGIRVAHASGDRKGENALEIFFIGGVYFVRPYPPTEPVVFEVEDYFPTVMIARLVICYLGMGRKDLAEPLREILFERDLDNSEMERHLLEVAKAYYATGNYKACKNFIDASRQHGSVDRNGEFHYIYGNVLSQMKDPVGAGKSFEECLELMPSHVDARINLADLQLLAGNPDLALSTLQGHDLDGCSRLPDERLLIRQADVLFEEKKTDQFIRCVRMLLTPHFYEVHKNTEVYHKRRSSRGLPALSNTLRVAALNVIQNTTFEKFVRRLGSIAVNENRSTNNLDIVLLHDYSFKLLETLLLQERYSDGLVVCCYAFLQPRMSKSDKIITFRNLLYYCATKAQSWPLAFEFVRWYHSMIMSGDPSPQLHKRVFNAMNYVFCQHQNVCYHRFIMRALTKSAGNHALQAISGNNSLITGTYRHALGEYLQVWNANQNNPLICLLLALTFTHMSCKKDLSSRHMIALRGIAFMKKYEKARACQQEVWYNIGRMFHQMSIMPLAIYFYEKVLNIPPPQVTTVAADGEEINCTGKYDLRPFAAHNLALIYRCSGNDHLARQIYEKYLVV